MSRTERHRGVDCLRILCMLIIVQYHIQGHGRMIISEHLSSLNHILIISLQAIYQLATNTYALISGYIGYQNRHRYASLVSLWLRVFVYSVGITAAVWLISPASVSWTEIKNSFFPLLRNQYWYFTAYAGCFMLAPLARSAISHLSQRDATICLSGVFFAFSVLPYVLHNDPFSIANGNHCLWLLSLYALGAYTKKYDPFAKWSGKKLLLLFFGACLVQVSTLFVVPTISHLLNGKAVSQWYFINNDSPTTLCLAFFLLAFFVKLSPRIHGRFFNLLATSSFSVYLIHDHPLIRHHVIVPLGLRLAQLPAFLPLIAVWVCAILIYLVCICIDAVREYVFRICRVNQFLSAAEKRILSYFPDNAA